MEFDLFTANFRHLAGHVLVKHGEGGYYKYLAANTVCSCSSKGYSCVIYSTSFWRPIQQKGKYIHSLSRQFSQYSKAFSIGNIIDTIMTSKSNIYHFSSCQKRLEIEAKANQI